MLRSRYGTCKAKISYPAKIGEGVMHRLTIALGFASLIVPPAHAESIRQQIIGAWILTEGAEQFPDGKKIAYWNSGQMIFDVSGRYALMLFKDRPHLEGMSDPRYPVGPMIAQFGSYRVDEET